MAASVVRTQTRVEDEVAVARLLNPLADASAIRALLGRGGRFFHQIWNREINIDFWFASDGVVLVCFAIGGLTVQQAAGVRRWWYSISEDLPDMVIDQEALINIVEAVSGTRLARADL